VFCEFYEQNVSNHERDKTFLGSPFDTNSLSRIYSGRTGSEVAISNIRTTVAFVDKQQRLYKHLQISYALIHQKELLFWP
jgi:hypothetical protein